MAGVVAAGLNAGFHQGGLRWAHQIAQDVEHNSAAVIALASGRADEFLAQAHLLSISASKDPCATEQPLGIEVAELANTDMHLDLPVRANKLQADSDQQIQAEVPENVQEEVQEEARQEVQRDMQRAHLEILRARAEAQVAQQSSHLREVSADFDSGLLRQISTEFHLVKLPACSRIRISVPTVPDAKIPAVHVDAVTAGPV